MKKIAILILILAFVSPFVLLASTSVVTPLQLRGYVYGETAFSVSFMNDVLPFNLESSEVGDNPNYASILSGLRIGTYSLESNVTSFVLYIAHDALVLTNRTFGTEGDTGTISTIDYRLYMEMGGSSFKSCLSDSEAGLSGWSAKTATKNMQMSGTNTTDWPVGTTYFSNKGIYVSLEDHTSGSTANTVANLMAGTYTSNIYFLLEGGL